MVKRAMVRAMRPTASSLLFSCRWSWAPRRHSQPEMAARGVMNRKHTMSQNKVRFSFLGPGSRSHCVEGERQSERQREKERERERQNLVVKHIYTALCFAKVSNSKQRKEWQHKRIYRGPAAGTHAQDAPRVSRVHASSRAAKENPNTEAGRGVQTRRKALTFVTSVTGLGLRSMVNSVWHSSQ